MRSESRRMKSIWHLVGIMLLVIGALVTASGIYYLVNPPTDRTVLAELQPNLWWGTVILVAGLIFTITHRNSTSEH